MMPLVVAGLRKQFGKQRVLDGVDLALEPGTVTALVGPNAAGKSTLIKCVLGLVRPDEGAITVLGETVGTDPGYRRHLGYMPQAGRYPENLTGEEVLSLLRDLRGTEVHGQAELCHTMGLGEEALRRPVRTWSGGMRQKLSAVVALAGDPPILILDEPTAGLDPLASSRFKQLVRSRATAGAAVLLTSHVMAEVEELADRLAYLVEGRVPFHGTPAELLMRTGEAGVERAVARLMSEAAA